MLGLCKDYDQVDNVLNGRFCPEKLKKTQLVVILSFQAIFSLFILPVIVVGESFRKHK